MKTARESMLTFAKLPRLVAKCGKVQIFVIFVIRTEIFGISGPNALVYTLRRQRKVCTV